ncbi:MAG: hypothetical protein U0K86_07630 [Agathobacter sp.]|nr:hypothetical protein [Agathobacter sp.]
MVQKIYRHKGSASLLNETPLQWKIDELGTKASEGASLEFTVKHIGSCSGTVKVNNYVSYEDKDLNIASFPSPEIEINCGDAVFPERCIKFVLPEDLDVSGSSNMICDTRNFKARFIAHYIDNDFECCNNVY